MSRTYVLRFYTQEPKAAEFYHSENLADMESLFERIRALTLSKAKFVIYACDTCIADWS